MIPDVLVVLEFTQTNGTLLSAIVFRSTQFYAFVFMWESVSLDNSLCGASINAMSLLHKTPIVLKTLRHMS